MSGQSVLAICILAPKYELHFLRDFIGLYVRPKCGLGTLLDKDACKKCKLSWFSDQVDAWKWSLVSVNSLTFYQLITDDDWRGSVVVEESILQTRRQRLQLRKERLWFLLLIELTLAVRICFLGKVGHIFFKNRLSLLFLANWASPSRTYSAKIRILKNSRKQNQNFQNQIGEIVGC